LNPVAWIGYDDAEPVTTMRLLVLQSRLASDPMLEHERRCFVAASGREDAELHFHNLVDGVPSRHEIAAHDALLVGGAGEFSVAQPDAPFFAEVAEMLRWVVRRRFPTFGSCFGYQLLVDALGGCVETDPAASEVGSFEVELTDHGLDDQLFGELPRTFVAQMGHLDCATELPAGVPNLASSVRCPHQALRVPGAPIWATQFHPELDDTTNLDRCLAYAKQYRDGTPAETRESLPSPEAATILPRFLELVLSTHT
jgi:GMP synthase (glutamine-hydrolysing)